jgi:hypothetical protein
MSYTISDDKKLIKILKSVNARNIIINCADATRISKELLTSIERACKCCAIEYEQCGDEDGGNLLVYGKIKNGVKLHEFAFESFDHFVYIYYYIQPPEDFQSKLNKEQKQLLREQKEIYTEHSKVFKNKFITYTQNL